MTEQKELKTLLIEVTRRCNLYCDQCGSRCEADEEDLLTKEQLIGLFYDLKEHIGTGVMLNITGGEPLLRKDLFEIMETATALGFDWGMVTNGTLIDDAVIGKLKKSGCKTITVSLDGVRETHDMLRHQKGCFDRILRALKLLKRADFLDHLQVTFTANKKNVYEFPKLYDIINKIGLDSIRVGLMDPIGRGEEHRDILLSRDEIRFLTGEVNRRNAAKKMPVLMGCPHFFGDLLKNRRFFCIAGIHAASVLYNGDIFVCPNVPRREELIQGNIKTDSFSEVWEKGFSFFRNRPLPPGCTDCRYREACRGDSLHTFDFEHQTPGFCYRRIFDNETEQYLADLKRRYPDYHTEIVDGDPGAADIYFEPEAYRELETYFHMGKKSPCSIYEQQVGLVGFRIDQNYVVKYIFPSYIKRYDAENARFDMGTVKQAEEETGIIKKCFGDSDDRADYVGEGLEFLGFAHSHTTEPELCYSEGDEKIHRFMTERCGHYIGILIRPDMEWIAAVYGEEMKQGNLRIIRTKEEKE